MKAKKLKKFVKLNAVSFSDNHFGSTTVKGCYANHLGNCKGKISKEHYISRNILERIENVPATGIPWLGHLEGNITSDMLVANILCEGHNSYLSPLDDLAGRIFDELEYFVKSKNKVVRISSVLLERWMLKVLVGYVAANRIKDVTLADIPQDWIDIIFGVKMMDEGSGIYINYKAKEQINSKKKLIMSPVFLEKKVIGLLIDLCGFVFNFLMVPKHVAFDDSHEQYSYILYRRFNLNHTENKNSLQFS